MKKFLMLTILAISFFSCVKTGDGVPTVGVNFQASLQDPKYSALNAPGGTVLVSGYGVAGLILHREASGSYVAYDRCSTYMPQNRCAVTLDVGGFTVTDPCSGAKWSISDGTPVKAPATISLKSYSIDVSNFEIFVSN